MIRRASTAALCYSSESLSLGNAHRATRLAAKKTESQQEVPMSYRFVLWGTLIL